MGGLARGRLPAPGAVAVLVVGDGLIPSVSTVLCVGAHSDDIEIGCGGTVMKLLAANPELNVHWVVLSAQGNRAEEAGASADRFLGGSTQSTVEIQSYRERYFPHVPELKEFFDALGSRVSPDLVLTHHSGDAHQDHRIVADLTWNTFRDQLILEYEIPKYDGDLGRPNVFVALGRPDRARQDTRDPGGVPFAEEPLLVHGGDVPRPDASPRDRSAG